MFSGEEDFPDPGHIQQCLQTLLIAKAVKMQAWGDDPVGKELLQKYEDMSSDLQLPCKKLTTEAPVFYPGAGKSKDKRPLGLAGQPF